MIYKSAYDTAALNGYTPQKYQQELHRASVAKDILKRIDAQFPNKRYIDAETNEGSFPVTSFNHPLELNGQMVVVDIRPHTRIDMRTRQVVTANASEVSFSFARAILEYALRQGGHTYLKTFSPLPIQVYASWISENVARRFMLDMGGQYRMSLLAGIHYLCLLDDKAEWTEQDKQVIARQMSEDMRVRSEDVFDILDKMDKPFQNLNDFCARTAELMENVRMKDFNAALLFTILGATWMGTNAREVACVAIEHIPTFIAMIQMAVVERGFNSSTFSKLVHRKGKREMDLFVTKLTGITVSYG